MADALPAPPPAIVITAAALPDPKAEKVYATTRLGARQIEQSPTHELDQLLKDVPGVQLFRRSDARSGHPTSQGVTLRALGGNASSRALLVLDGVPQTDPFGGWINWPAYDPASLAGIRVVRGGGSVANGPGALAGTIEMTSRTDAVIGGEVDGGSRDSVEAGARLGLALGPGVLALSGRAERGAGFVPIARNTRGPADKRAPYGQWSGRGHWVAAVGPDLQLQANLGAFHDWRTRGTDFSGDRTNGADASLRLVGTGAWRWSALGYWQWRDLMSSTAGVSAGRAIATRVLLQYAVPSQGLGGSVELRPPMPQGIELRLGADTRRTSGETRELANYVGGNATRRRRAGGETWTAGAFAEASAEFRRLTLSAGARIDRWEVSGGHLIEQTIATGAVTRDDVFATRHGWLPTVRAGVLAPLGSGLSLRAAGYRGWRMPTLNELFRPFRAGGDATAANPELDPERLAGTEGGLEYASGPWRGSITGFVNRLSHAIVNVTLAQGPGNFPQVGFVAAGGAFRQRENAGAVSVRGIEASVSWTRGPWTLGAALSTVHARMEATGAAVSLNGLRPAQTPSFAGTLSASWQRGPRGFEIALGQGGGQYEDDLSTRLLKPATTLDASASWPLVRRLQLLARVENATDALVMSGIGSDGSVERATPRTLWLGLRLR